MSFSYSSRYSSKLAHKKGTKKEEIKYREGLMLKKATMLSATTIPASDRICAER